ncbi:Ldh family oxidoreductase [Methylovirgula sp. 4M-Z18]|uniref:Ldh family oxidoreductase n=1 Tax=Methylovirgula sp. 4M-Z18 TaxID=2293567 RepID=UPI000E2F5FE7|nr:Ldh family oxidoreductase [Methylovirgula sp. 4M-Z18]RFB79344.1 Ldh family oxidoreductase [Methylovirgula sp. 4M-Z18]
MDMRYDSTALIDFAAAALAAAGLEVEPAGAVARGLVEADLLGHSTHGLALLADYIEELDNGTMEKTGRPAVIADHAAAALWDGHRLPGVWTTALAVDDAVKRAGTFGIGAITVRRSHHIACLAAFLEAPARRGHMVLIFSSDPSDAHVAPFGGLNSVMTPNPIAAGIPTEGDPILIDVSTSITTAAMCGRTAAAGGRLPGRWVMDRDGAATDDPAVVKQGGSILPIGGLDHGHKGYGLSLLVEALTQGLGAYGRADGPTQWGAGVLVLALSPALFGGLDAFTRQTGWLGSACRAARVRPGDAPVRLPGEAALARKREAIARGVRLHAGIAGDLERLAGRFGLPMPASPSHPASSRASESAS